MPDGVGAIKILRTGALAVAWEGAGGARACHFSGIPFLEIRGITDSADSDAASDFRATLEGTSFHYAPAGVVLHTDERLNGRLLRAPRDLGVELVCGKHSTTDAICRSMFEKVRRYREQGVNSTDMERSALAGVAHYQRCALSALLLVADVVSRSHSWEGVTSAQFQEGVRRVVRVAVEIACRGAFQDLG